jgi:hypothetical protein
MTLKIRSICLFFLGLLLSIATSCETVKKVNSVNFKITNNTYINIELIYLSTVYDEAKTSDNTLDSKSMIEIKFGFIDVAESDGSYSLLYKFENSSDTIRRDFGYYTNGYPLESEFNIKIYNDSIGLNSTSRDFY